jgi:hypothetical protein
MQFFTFSDLKTKLGNDYDITDENFVNDTELVGYINEAIDDAETAIHNLHHEKKYFLNNGWVTLVNGTQEYGLPSDIYGNKIRLLMYINGATKYPIKMIKMIEDIPFITAGDEYQYLLINDPTNYVRLQLHPTPAEAGQYVRAWYIRNMKRLTTSLTDSTNICELPECTNFVYRHVGYSLARKTRRTDIITNAKEDLRIQYDLMTTALNPMTSEEDSEMRMDLSSYWDQEGEIS